MVDITKCSNSKKCKNCKYHYKEEISFDYPQSCCSKEMATTEEWCTCNAFEYSDRYIEQLQQENQELKERIEYLERSNNRREDAILEQREEVCNRLESNWNVLKKYLENKWTESQDIWFVKIINKMQELEQKK